MGDGLTSRGAGGDGFSTGPGAGSSGNRNDLPVIRHKNQAAKKVNAHTCMIWRNELIEGPP